MGGREKTYLGGVINNFLFITRNKKILYSSCSVFNYLCKLFYASYLSILILYALNKYLNKSQISISSFAHTTSAFRWKTKESNSLSNCPVETELWSHFAQWPDGMGSLPACVHLESSPHCHYG